MESKDPYSARFPQRRVREFSRNPSVSRAWQTQPVAGARRGRKRQRSERSAVPVAFYPRTPPQPTYPPRPRPYANKNSLLRSSLIVSRSFAAFSNSKRLAASRISLSNFPM